MCDKCIHKNVCAMKTEYNKLKESLQNTKSDSEYFSIDVICSQHKPDYNMYSTETLQAR